MANSAAKVKAGCSLAVAQAIATLMSKAEDERQARLAQALRDNLRRRKARARTGDRQGGDGATADSLPESQRG